MHLIMEADYVTYTPQHISSATFPEIVSLHILWTVCQGEIDVRCFSIHIFPHTHTHTPTEGYDSSLLQLVPQMYTTGNISYGQPRQQLPLQEDLH